MSLDSATFRQLLGHFATGVTVITATDADGRPHGMTANSLTSVSLDPPLLLLCVDHKASMHGLLSGGARFAVNILSSEQEQISRRFAGKHDDKFDGVGYRTTEKGHVLLEGALATIECEPHQCVEAGDHTIVLGRVTGGATHAGHPLLYFRGGYAAIG